MATEASTATSLVTPSLPSLPIADSASSLASQDEAEAAVETSASTPLPPQQTGENRRSMTHPAVTPVTPPPLYQQPRASSTQSDIESNSSSRSSYRTIVPNKPSFQYYLQFRLSGSLEEVQRGESPTPQKGSSTDTIPAKTTTSTLKLVWWFFIDVIFRQVYWHLILRVPGVYWSRIERIVSDADISEPEIAFAIFQERNGKRVKNSAASLSETVAMNKVRSRSKRFDRLHNSWDHFLSSAMREWKIMNLVSVLLLGAIASLLQIEVVSNDPFIRTAAFISMLCALMSLLYGCLYSIRFFDLKKSYKALQWAAEAHKNQLNPFWNIWVFMAMPAIWLVWSLIAYLVCFMTYMWRAGGDGLVANPRGPLGLRILVTCILCLGLLYLFLITKSLGQYGRPMEDEWRDRVQSLSKLYHLPNLASGPDSSERKSVYHDEESLTSEKAKLDLVEEFDFPVAETSDSDSVMDHPGPTTSYTSTRPLIITVNAPHPRLKSAIKDSSDSPPQTRRVRFAPSMVDTTINTQLPELSVSSNTSQDHDLPSGDAVEKELPSSNIPPPIPASLPFSEYLDGETPSPPIETPCAEDAPHETLTSFGALFTRAELEKPRLHRCFDRPVPDDMKPLSGFISVKLFSLDPRQIVTLPLGVQPVLRRGITSEDLEDFLLDVALTFHPRLSLLDDGSRYCHVLLPLIIRWNKLFFIKRGLQAGCGRLSGQHPLKKFVIYLFRHGPLIGRTFSPRHIRQPPTYMLMTHMRYGSPKRSPDPINMYVAGWFEEVPESHIMALCSLSWSHPISLWWARWHEREMICGDSSLIPSHHRSWLDAMSSFRPLTTPLVPCSQVPAVTGIAEGHISPFQGDIDDRHTALARATLNATIATQPGIPPGYKSLRIVQCLPEVCFKMSPQDLYTASEGAQEFLYGLFHASRDLEMYSSRNNILSQLWRGLGPMFENLNKDRLAPLGLEIVVSYEVGSSGQYEYGCYVICRDDDIDVPDKATLLKKCLSAIY